MNRPITHPRTQKLLESYLQQPAHALLLVGKDGSGRFFLSQWLATQRQLSLQVVERAADKATISIEQIRALYRHTRTGTPQIIVIKDAEHLGVDAQNAFLKLLEEPPAQTSFILTATDAESLLPTIRSRSVLIPVLPPPKQALAQLAEPIAPEQRSALLHTLQERPGTLVQLTSDHEALAAYQTALSEAKQFYSGNAYTRFKIMHQHGYERSWALQLLNTLSLLIEALLRSQAGNQKMLAKLTAQAELAETIYNTLEAAGNPKIQLTYFAVSL